MDKKFYAIAVSAICAMNVYAGPVDVNKAQTMAKKFIGNPVSVGPSVVKSRGTRTSEPSLHLFNNQDGEGFVIVAGDDRVGGVLGYSDRGRLDAENMSAPMKKLLERYARAVELVKVDSISVTPVYAKPPKASVNRSSVRNGVRTILITTIPRAAAPAASLPIRAVPSRRWHRCSLPTAGLR